VSDQVTDTVIRWVLRFPVLTLRLWEIAHEDGEEAMICMLADLMDPQRDSLHADILEATGARADDANTTWQALGGDKWPNTVTWDQVMKALGDHAPKWAEDSPSRP
jgi:hypothetical protein